jgi:hypothetical protein
MFVGRDLLYSAQADSADVVENGAASGSRVLDGEQRMQVLLRLQRRQQRHLADRISSNGNDEIRRATSLQNGEDCKYCIRFEFYQC